MSTSGYSLLLCTYDRGEDPFDPTKKKPYHWAFILVTDPAKRNGRAFQLRGMPGGFYYSGEESVNIDGSQRKVHELDIGTVPGDKYDRFKQLLAAAPVTNDETSKWNCQNWSLQVLDWLRGEGFITEDYKNEIIQYWVRENQ